MDIQSLFQISTLFHASVVGIVVYFIRTWLELKFPSLITNKQFTGIYLPTLAIIISLVIVLFSGLSPSYLIGAKLIDRVGYSIITGFCSGYIFSALKSILQKESEK
jgi:hypothetical protein